MLKYKECILIKDVYKRQLSGLVEAGAGIAIILNTPLINTNKISVIKIKDKIDDKSIYMVWNKNIIHNKNKTEFKNYALNVDKR